MAPGRRRGRRGIRRWNRGHNGGRVDRGEDTLSGDPVRRVVDSFCPYCATDIRSIASRNILRCPNTKICGKMLPLDDNCCPSCRHYIRPTDNFCRVCRANLRDVVRGRGGLYQQLRRAPSPINVGSIPTEDNPDNHSFPDEDSSSDYEPEDVGNNEHGEFQANPNVQGIQLENLPELHGMNGLVPLPPAPDHLEFQVGAGNNPQ